jgi:WD40 repeat protein
MTSMAELRGGDTSWSPAGAAGGEDRVAAIRRDHRERWLRGERVPVEAYLGGAEAGTAVDADSALVLVHGEYLLRQELGEAPALEEYLDRFPSLAERLRAVDSVHRLLVGESVPEPEKTAAAFGPPGYTILGELGRGGMGIVLKARQERLNRTVAVKMIRLGSLAGETDLRRFHIEAEAAAKLDHPHIVPIYEVGQVGDLPFFSMKLMEGGSLEERLGRSGEDPRLVAGLAVAIAEAVHHAHQRGILHRDLKPANVLLDAEGRPNVVDFGLARSLEEDSTLTQSGTVLGTPSYMAPEQATGGRGGATTAADVYSLGAILYALIAGRPPFKACTPIETLRHVVDQEPPAPRTLNPTVDRDLEAVCLKCLRKDPRDRYGSARELADDLRRYLDGRPIQVRRTTAVERGWRWCRRNPFVASLLTSIGLLIVAIAVVSTVLAARLGVEARRARAAERHALERLFHSSFAQAKAVRGTGRYGQRHDTLKALAEAADLNGRVTVSPQDILDLRAEAIAAMTLPDIRPGPMIEAEPAGINGRCLDSAYRRYANSTRDGEVTVRHVSDDRVLRRFIVDAAGGLNRGVNLGFSPGDRYLAIDCIDLDAMPAFVWDLENPEDRPFLAVRGGCCAWSVSEAGGIAVIGTNDKRVRRFDLRTGRELPAFDVGILPSAVAIQPQGRVLAVAATEPPVVQLLDLQSGRLLNSLSHAQAEGGPGIKLNHGVASVAWHPDGELLATGCYDHKIYVWDWLAGRTTGVLTGHTWEVATVTFSHSGDLLASYGHDRTIRLWDHRAGTLLLTAPPSRSLAFSRDDRHFIALSREGRTTLPRLDVPAEFRLFEGHSRRRAVVQDIRFHPRGRLLATASMPLTVAGAPMPAGDGVRLWDMATGREVARLSTAHTHGVLFEEDGKGILTYDAHQLRRWPLESSTRGGRELLRIGPPQRLLTLDDAAPLGRMVFCGPDRKRLAIADPGRGVNLIELEPRPRVVQSWRTATAEYLAASPDGRWVATGSISGPGFQVWDTHRNEPAHLWNTGDAGVAFSPDGLWLASGSDGLSPTGAECCLWEVGTWRRGPSIPLQRTSDPARLAFSDDGRMLAVERTLTELALLDPRDMRELARLQSREPMILTPMRFSPDGSVLAAGTASGYLHVWDLRQIRARLRDMHLDWDLPPFGPSPDASAVEQPLEVDLRLDPSSLIERAHYFLETQDYRHALADLEVALQGDAARPEAWRGLVNVLANGPGALRDLDRASNLARAAHRRDPADLAGQGDLGMILYRQGHYAEAVASLEPAARSHADPVERARWRIFLAMSQHCLGQTRAAQESYRRARADLADVKPSHSAAEDFARLWQEADATLHVAAGSP